MEKEFKNILKDLRVEKGISQKQLAKEIQVSDGTICFWENGINEPKLTYIKRLAVFFGVSADYLIGLKIDDACDCNEEIEYTSTSLKYRRK